MHIRFISLAVLAALLVPAMSMAQPAPDDDDATRATFEVLKDFQGPGQGDNETEVEVTISCNTGLPLEQTGSIEQSESNGVVFVVESFDSDELDCSITEDPPAGYSPHYSPDGQSNNNDDNDDSCDFTDVSDGDENICVITNSPDPIEVNIVKEWVIENGDNLNGVSTEYCIQLDCDTEIVESNGSWGQDSTVVDFCHHTQSDTEGDEWYALVIPAFEEDEGEENPADCNVNETIYDNTVESSDDCDSQIEIAIAGDSQTCTVTNTIFFEGIPTLNPYGLAVLMLSMLGLGFVAYRRFA